MLTNTKILLSQMVISGEKPVGKSKILIYHISTKT